MAFLVSPGVEVNEIDLTGIVPAVSTSIGGYAGHFDWGPVGDLVNLSDEGQMANYFGTPSVENIVSFLTASTFLRYGNTLLVSRAIGVDAVNATDGTDEHLFKNIENFEKDFLPANLNDHFYARYPGVYGNSLQVQVLSATSDTRHNITKIYIGGTEGDETVLLDIEGDAIADNSEIAIRQVRSSLDWVNEILNSAASFYIEATATPGQYLLLSSPSIPETSEGANDEVDSVPYNPAANFTVALTDEVLCPTVNNGFGYVPPQAANFESTFKRSPGTSAWAELRGVANDEIHVLVIDEDGSFSGTPGTILERWENLSVIPGATYSEGGSMYYRDVINNGSNYIIANSVAGEIVTGADNADLSGLTISAGTDLIGSIWIGSLTLGNNGTNDAGNVYDALELFADAETLDVNLLFAENDDADQITIANRLIRLAEGRKDCVVFISPDLKVASLSNDDAMLDDIISKFDRLASSNYVVFDSTPLYIYSKYQDKYYWVPGSGSMAGLCARTDDVRDPWWSPAGYDRGQLLGVAKIAYNPQQAHRDALYKARINPIVSFPGEGIMLYGDKTAQAKPSAFDRINVRRLFITLEKAIATAAKYQLFEFNDEFTRAQFVNMVAPYLRDIQGRRGITDFIVVCDGSNNTGEVIDSNRFIADIYIKPARAINFITLNFVATRTGVEFSEVIGKF